MSKSQFQAPKGTRDIMAPESNRVTNLLSIFEETLNSGGYGQIISPIFEDIGVFQRLGDSSQIVTKEMFDLFDKELKLRTFSGSLPRIFDACKIPIGFSFRYISE